MFLYYADTISLKLYLIQLLVLFSSLAIPGYLNNFVLIPKLLMQRKFLTYFILLIILLLIASPISFYITKWTNIHYPELNYLHNRKDFNIYQHAIRCILWMAVLATGKFTVDAFINQRKLEKLEKQKLFNELESLKSQINPHFLFNSLNTIFGLAKKDRKETADAVQKLSDILRYVIYESNVSFITLSKEINLIESFIEFARLRSNAKIEFLIEGEMNHYQIAPLILLPLVENAIKHGLENHIKNPWMSVKVNIKDCELYFICANNNLNKNKEQTPLMESKNFGLKNLKRRLELIYESRYKLEITNNEKEFIAFLKIELK